MDEMYLLTNAGSSWMRHLPPSPGGFWHTPIMA